MVKKSEKRSRVVSLLSMLSIALIVFVVVGVMINWNIFVVVALFIPILAIGIGIIFVPAYLKRMHNDFSNKIDKKLDEVAKTISKK